MKVILVSLVVYLGSAFGQKCDESRLKWFDETFSKVNTYGNPDMKFPESPQQLQVWCKQSRGYINELEEYNKKCNKQLFRQLMNVYIYAYRTSLRKYCKPKSRISIDFLDSTVCFNRNKNVEVGCYTNLIDRWLGILNEPDDKKRIPYLCCFQSCFTDKLANAPSCNEKRVRTMIGFIESQATNVLEMLCGDYTDDSDNCNRLGEPPKKLKSQRRTKSIGLPAANILSSFKEV